MQFLKTLFWVMILVAGIIFSYNNWQPVTVSLWGGMVLDTSLPFLLMVSFLVGFLPVLLWHRASRWHMSRKLDQAERALSDIRTVPTTPVVVTENEPLPPVAVPIAVPPGVS